jgi:single-stranded-DNA-specific exonuclease
MAVKSARDKLWKLREPPPAELLPANEQDSVIAVLLFQRLYQTAPLPDDPPAEAARDAFTERMARFMDDAYPHGMHDPLLMRGMHEASARIAQAIANDEPMAVYGDFDTDGVTAVTLLMQAITAMGGNIAPYIPHREREGYGLNMEAVENLAAQGVRLLITVDCGISNVAEVQHANELGLDVIVTDHHQPPATLPPAFAIVNPKQPDCAYPFKQLVGVGIAFKLVYALFRHGLRPEGLRGRDMLDVVALGTVADMGPLEGENRVLVKAGIEALRQTTRPGLRALIEVAGLNQELVDSTAIGFMLGPRINAAGRLDDAVRAYNLLLADDLETAQRLAEELNQANRLRQQMTKDLVRASMEDAIARGADQHRIVVLDSESYPAGIVGLVAARLVEQWARPVVLIARGSAESRGSARSVPGFNIFRALTTCHEQCTDKDLFVRFGGHSLAAGFTIRNEHLPELAERLRALADAELTDDLLQPTLSIDAEMQLGALNWDLLHELALLEPFGQANQQPVLMSRRVYVQGAWSRGNEGQHLKLHLTPQANYRGAPMQAIAFGLGHLAEPLRRHPWIDIAYTLEANTWKGTRSLQLNVKDFRRA